MSDAQIRPEKVTKPIQLLAAWLVGLIVVNASFLVGAQQIINPSWAAGLLVISAVANVPIFIIALFLLQTKFRPQMQEDAYYAQYLKTEREYTTQVSAPVPSAVAIDEAISKAAVRIAKELGASGRGQEQPIVKILRESQVESLVERFGGARSLSELYLSLSTWPAIVKQWSKNEDFVQDIESLLAEGLVARRFKGYLNCSLTDLGQRVAEIAQSKDLLWAQKQKDFWESERQKLASNT